MDWQKKTTDWQVCCLGQVAGGTGVAAGYFLFCFYSAQAGGSAYYTFGGVGFGVGGNTSGVLNPADYGSISSPWSGMSNVPWFCGVNPFSANDLNGAGGRLSSLGGGVFIVGYSVTYITATPLLGGDDYFFSQSVGGLGYGPSGGQIGASGEVLAGTWTFAREATLRP
jgi:hypothetical protein